MVDSFTVTATLLAICSAATCCWLWQRVVRAETEAAELRRALLTERHAACHDELTGLPNRRAFHQRGARLLADVRRRPLVAVVLDLNNFKQVNDRYGHLAGDHVLAKVAQRFAHFAGDSLVTRLGGDEFAGLLVGVTDDPRRLEQASQGLAAAVARPIRIGGRTVRVTASVGMAAVTDPVPLAEALRRADAAMYRAKRSAPDSGTSSRAGSATGRQSRTAVS